MTPHDAIAVTEASQVGEARRRAAQHAAARGLDEAQVARVQLVATELGNNLVKHARAGRLLVGSAASGGPALDLLALDDGPGMADLGRCLQDGYSTAGTPGTGFGAVRRQSDVFSAYSAPGRGTVVLSRIGAATAADGFELGGITLAAPGERVSGDAWHFRAGSAPGRAAVLVADGLGHGPVAAEAADAAVALFAGALGAKGCPSDMLTAMHPLLRGTRGAAVAVAAIDARARSITFSGAGNIAARLLSGLEDRTLMSQHGTLGMQIRRLVDTEHAWPPHACIVLHSDGLTSRWSLGDDAPVLRCDPAVIAAWLLRAHVRGRDDATVVVIRSR